MNEAAAGERLQVGLPVAPASQRRSPLPRAAHLVHLLQGEDHAAVDDARDLRRELARGDRHHGLVEEREAVLDPARFDEHLTAGVTGERSSVGVPEALGDRFGLRRHCGRTGRSLRLLRAGRRAA